MRYVINKDPSNEVLFNLSGFCLCTKCNWQCDPHYVKH